MGNTGADRTHFFLLRGYFKQNAGYNSSYCAITMTSYQQRRIVLIELGYTTYDDYLRSTLWGSIRATVLKRCKSKCEVCPQQIATEVHHKSYNHSAMAGSTLGDLVGICRSCHQCAEFHPNGDKRTHEEVNMRILAAMMNFKSIKKNRQLQNKALKRRCYSGHR